MSPLFATNNAGLQSFLRSHPTAPSLPRQTSGLWGARSMQLLLVAAHVMERPWQLSVGKYLSPRNSESDSLNVEFGDFLCVFVGKRGVALSQSDHTSLEKKGTVHVFDYGQQVCQTNMSSPVNVHVCMYVHPNR